MTFLADFVDGLLRMIVGKRRDVIDRDADIDVVVLIVCARTGAH